MTEEEIDDLRRRGVEFLLSQQKEEKQPYEFDIKELCRYWKISETTARRRMLKLVEVGTWGTRYALDESLHKPVKVWWLKT